MFFHLTVLLLLALNYAIIPPPRIDDAKDVEILLYFITVVYMLGNFSEIYIPSKDTNIIQT